MSRHCFLVMGIGLSFYSLSLVSPRGSESLGKMKQNSLIIFTKASQKLAEADTIQKAKELKSLAAADWAKRKGLGEQTILHTKSYALEAERKMGEILLQTERAKGTDKAGKPSLDGSRALPSNPPPTLSEIGLSKRESSEAQKLLMDLKGMSFPETLVTFKSVYMA
jgi:hypothetical protein